MKRPIYCPICEKQTSLDEKNPFRPFCCERCRLIDLGQWIEESYTIPESVYPDINDVEDNNVSIKH